MARRILNTGFAGGELSPEMFGRLGDAYYQHGAAKLENFISKPQGPAFKRPGFQFVREIKDSTRTARLIPFHYSQDQTLILELSRATVASRDIGYIRFHTGGQTLLYALPRDYVEPRTPTIAPVGSDVLTIGAHGYLTGDPIVLTMIATTETVTVDDATDTVTHIAHGANNGDQVIFESTVKMPGGLVERQIYYVLLVDANSYKLSPNRLGNPIDITSTGTGTITAGLMPAANLAFVDANVRLYAIFDTSTTIKLAATLKDALDGTAIDLTGIGTTDRNDIRVHYDYRPGDLVYYPTATAAFYCMKIPWGEVGSIMVETSDHLDRTPADPAYFAQLPGTRNTVTIDVGTDEVTWTAHGFANSTPVTFTTTGALPSPLVAGTVYYIREAKTNTFQLAASANGPLIDLNDPQSGVHTAWVGAYFEVPHFIAETALPEVTYAQSGDVMTLCHNTRPIAELRRLGATRWTLADLEFNAAIDAPTNVEATRFRGEGMLISAITAATPGIFTTYTNHNFNEAIGEQVEVLDVKGTTGVPDGLYIIDTIPAGPTTFTLKTVEEGTQVATGGTYTVNSGTVRPVLLDSERTNDYKVTALNANGEESAPSTSIRVTNNLLVPGAYNDISWDAVVGAVRYRIYKRETGLYGFIGEVDAELGTAFHDNNIGPDFGISPPTLDTSLFRENAVTFDFTRDTVTWAAHGLLEGQPVTFHTKGTLPAEIDVYETYFVLAPEPDTFQISTTLGGTAHNFTDAGTGTHSARAGQWPSAVAYFEQRRCFAGAIVLPQDVWMTASGTESDLSYSIPTQDSDRIQHRIAARERSAIRHIVPLGHLILLTQPAEYRVTSVNNDALTPSSFSARSPTHIGAKSVQPALMNNQIIFAANRGGHIREMGFSDAVGDYQTGDISLRAAHLFDDFEIVSMAAQKAPMPVVWCVSDNGKLLGLTYVPEHLIGAWHQHTTDGTFESIAVVAEGEEDRLYAVIKRNINGGDVRYIERMHVQEVNLLQDVFRVDAGASYSGAAITVLPGLEHLEGESVKVLADGKVQGPFTVTAGRITLTTAASTIHVGLTYTSELQTLPATLQLDAFGRGRTMNVNKAWLRVYESGAFSIGPSATDLEPSENPAAGLLKSGDEEVTLPAEWQVEGTGQVVVQQSDPLPLTAVALVLEIEVGGG